MSEKMPSSRDEASERGDRYYQGTKCHKGHSGLRYTSCSNCVECDRDRSRERWKEKMNKNPYAKRIALDHMLDERVEDYWGEVA